MNNPTYSAKACIIRMQREAADCHHWAVSAMQMARPDTPGWIRQAATEQRVAAIHARAARANLIDLIA